MAVLTLQLLGPVVTTVGDTTPAPLRGRNARALLFYLAVEAAWGSQNQPREQLMALLWPEARQSAAQVNLRRALYLVRQAVGNVEAVGGGEVPLLIGDRHIVGFHPQATYDLDVAAFLRLVENPADVDAQAEAAALFRGDFLSDFYLADSQPFEEWVAARRAALRAQALEALGIVTEARMRQGRYTQAERYARRQLELDNLRESAHRQLMRALDASGQRAAALTQYEICRTVLAEALGVAPVPETEKLAAAIRAGSHEAAAVATPARGCASNVPAPATPLIGRAQELDRVLRFLYDTSLRLVTVTGEGGIGKTRLAQEAAIDLATRDPCPFRDGVFFLPLAPLTVADQLVPHLVTTLQGVLPKTGHGSQQQALLAHLQDKELLLVLDNFDHLLEAAPLVAAILQAAPRVQILVTSRERLRLHGEQMMPLQGLRYGRAPGEQAAAQLFLAAARRLVPAYTLGEEDEPHLQRLCRLVAGMPLALELAAGWVDVLPLAETVARLAAGQRVLATDVRDFPARHRSIESVFDASWVQLDGDERRAFAALALFRGGFTRAAAAAVVQATPRLLARFVDRSLLHYDRKQDRFYVHPLLRRYATEKLAATPQEAEAARDRHLAYFVTLATDVEAQRQGDPHPQWLSLLDAELANLRVALAWAEEKGDAEALARMSGALGVFWGIRGHLNEGQTWIAAALARRVSLSSAVLADLLFARGWLAFERGDYAAARDDYRESHNLMVTCGDRSRVAHLLQNLGHVAQQQGAFDRAMALCTESLALYRQMDDLPGIATCLNRLGHLALLESDTARAASNLEESLALRQALGDERGVAASLNGLAELARYQGEYDRARALYERSLAICAQLADKRCVAGLNHNLGHVALRKGDTAAAWRHFRRSLKLYRELDNVEGISLCLVGLAGLHGLARDGQRASLLLSAATRLAEENRFVKTAADRDSYDTIIATIRANTDEATFARSWQEGQTVPLAVAVAQAYSKNPPPP